jgi:tetratricopeptide (TPR) repeat protein
VALSPDGRWAATGTFKGADIKVWELGGEGQPQPVHTIPCDTARAVFSPDGRWLLVEEREDTRFYKTGSWERAEVLQSKRAYRGVVFARDAPLMALPYDNRRHVGLLAPETGREIAVLASENSQIIGEIAISPDGAQLAVTRSDHAVELWDLRAVRQRLVEMGLDWELPAYPDPTEPRVDPLQVKVIGADLVEKLPTALPLNNEAWKLLIGPENQRNPARALELARVSVELEPDNAIYLNTLGAAQYRNGLLKEAVATLEKSLAVGNGETDAFDLFFLAMCHAKLGDKVKAHDYFDRAVTWIRAQQKLPSDWAAELKEIRAEAEAELAKLK